MIVDWIVGIVLGALSAVFGLVPASDTDSMLASTNYQSGAWGILAQGNRILPIEDVLVCIALALTWQLLLLMWAAAQWIYDKLPFKAS